jgi:hypothetical protein
MGLDRLTAAQYRYPAIKFSFDSPETGWGLNSLATIVTDTTASLTPPSLTPPKILRLNFDGAGTTSAAFHALSGLVLNETYRVFIGINFDQMGDLDAFVRFQYIGAGVFEKLMFKDPAVTGWELRDAGVLTYIGPDTLFINGISTAVLGNVYVDSIYIGYIGLPGTYLPLGNGQGPIRWQSWHTDDIMGTPVPRDEAVRDRYNRLVDVFQGLDESAHDEIIQNPRPTERHRKDP